MKFGIVTRNSGVWSVMQLKQALADHNVQHVCFTLPQVVARVGYGPLLTVAKTDLAKELNAMIIRPIGKGSLEEIVFRMDTLYRLQRSGLLIINPPEAIEHCSDKYDVLAILEENGIKVPRTAVTENRGDALKAFNELGRDVVIKPIFGSRGVGATRLTDSEVASTLFKALSMYHNVIYLQEFVPHGSSDIRAFVIGDRVVASMRRVASSWKTNYSQGARPEAVKLDRSVEDLAVKSAKLVDCKVAGVDILESRLGNLVLEVNSRPGWRGLQSITSTNIADEIVSFMLSMLKR